MRRDAVKAGFQHGIVALIGLCGCARTPLAVAALPASHPPIVVETRAIDTAPKEAPRLVPAEAYVRTYLALFGSLAPLEVQRRARGSDGAQLFDAWNDYLTALGFPDHRLDLPRATQTNSLMVAAFERLGVALCDRSLEHDWHAKPPSSPPPLAQRGVFAFDPPAPGAPLDEAAFAAGFDVLHRTFLGYPARLAPSDRAPRFRRLFDETVRRHEAVGAQKSRFTPSEAGWAAVCYALVRHPEFHFY